MVKTTRRQFMTAILAAAALGTLSTDAALAQAPAPDLQDVATTVRMYQELVSYYHSVRVTGVPRWTPGHLSTPEAQEELDRRADDMLAYAMQCFSESPCTAQDILAWMKYPQPELLSTRHLEVVVRGTIPVLLMRNILTAKNHIPARIHRSKNWTTFCQVYKHRLIEVFQEYDKVAAG